jgi:soluble cytochrome b562
MSYKVMYIFNKHIIQPDNDVKDREERAYYAPLLVGALQELMREKVISLEEKITKKPRRVIEDELDIVGYKEMFKFTCSITTFMEALLEKPLHEKYCAVLFHELMRQVDAIDKKIKE